MENDLNAAVAIATADAAPVLGAAPVLTETLPGGFIDQDGVLHTDVVVRELTGVDEEAIDSVARGVKNAVDLTDTLLMRGITRIGTVSEITKDVVQRLLIGDRNAVAIFIRRATYGDVLTGQIACPACGESNDVSLDLAKDITIKQLEEGNKRVFTVQLRNNRSAELRLANGSDQHALGEFKNPTLAEMNTMLLSRCVVSIDGQSILDDMDGPEAAVKSLGSADRQTLLEHLASNQPGPQFEEVSVPCASCGAEIPTPVDVAGLLL